MLENAPSPPVGSAFVKEIRTIDQTVKSVRASSRKVWGLAIVIWDGHRTHWLGSSATRMRCFSSAPYEILTNLELLVLNTSLILAYTLSDKDTVFR